ncbi:MAG: lysine--tRNA ligase, partial [Candidatus Methanomethylophilaceae archaeon]|nr:lysine--tRNA ligase [Candidatus Methanomethylophilaceae archaeon]
VQKQMPQVQLTDDEKAFLKAVLAGMQSSKWDADEIGQVISEAGKASPIGAKGGFRTMYMILIAKERGPRLGNFLASMDRDFVLGRIGEAAQ